MSYVRELAERLLSALDETDDVPDLLNSVAGDLANAVLDADGEPAEGNTTSYDNLTALAAAIDEAEAVYGSKASADFRYRFILELKERQITGWAETILDAYSFDEPPADDEEDDKPGWLEDYIDHLRALRKDVAAVLEALRPVSPQVTRGSANLPTGGI